MDTVGAEGAAELFETTDMGYRFVIHLPCLRKEEGTEVRITFWSLTAWVQIPTRPLTTHVPWSELFVPSNSALSPAQQSESHIGKNWVS